MGLTRGQLFSFFTCTKVLGQCFNNWGPKFRQLICQQSSSESFERTNKQNSIGKGFGGKTSQQLKLSA